MVTLEGQKMGKSLGNAINLNEFFTGNHTLLTRAWNPEVIRFFLLQSHYRSTTDFSEEALEAAESGLKNFHSIIRTIEKATVGSNSTYPIEKLKSEFEMVMNDDFNSAQAIAVLFEHGKEIRKLISAGNAPSNMDEVQLVFKSFADDVIGVWPNEEIGNSNLTNGLVELLISIRKEARINKNFALSDKIRDDLKVIGVQLKDGKDGTTYELD